MPQVFSVQEKDNKNKIAEGKTKIIWRVPGNPRLVRIESKNDLTKGGGAVRTSWEEKGAQANRATCSIFRHLAHLKIVPTHFKEQIDDRNFLAERVFPWEVEFIARRIATGSVLDRIEGLEEGTVFEQVLLEIFFKGAKNDPYVLYNAKTQWYDQYDPKKPVSPETYWGEVPRNAIMPTEEELRIALGYHLLVFEATERAWADQGVVEVDLKCEYGKTLDGTIVLADVIDGDSGRYWPGGDQSQAKDKDVFRKTVGEITQADKELYSKNYEWLEATTAKFPGNC